MNKIFKSLVFFTCFTLACSTFGIVDKKDKITYIKSVYFDKRESEKVWSRIHYYIYKKIGKISHSYHPYYIHTFRYMPYYQEINIFREFEKDRMRLIIEYSELSPLRALTESERENLAGQTKSRLLKFIKGFLKYLKTGEVLTR
ncbi:hypothetical protein ACFL20_02990 [Spirochaetota bacterium]